MKARKALIFAFFAVLAFILIYFHFSTKPVYEAYLDSVRIAFRADLREAKNVRIENEEKIKEIFWNDALKRINLVFVNSTQNYLVQIQIFETAFKLTLAYEIFNRSIEIKAKEIESYENLEGNEENLIVAFIPPIFSNQTLVYEKDFVVFIEAKNAKDFDLATIKFLITVLRIRI